MYGDGFNTFLMSLIDYSAEKWNKSSVVGVNVGVGTIMPVEAVISFVCGEIHANFQVARPPGIVFG